MSDRGSELEKTDEVKKPPFAGTMMDMFSAMSSEKNLSGDQGTTKNNTPRENDWPLPHTAKAYGELFRSREHYFDPYTERHYNADEESPVPIEDDLFTEDELAPYLEHLEVLDRRYDNEETTQDNTRQGEPDPKDHGKKGERMFAKNDETLRFSFDEETAAKIRVIGVGGAGSNAVDNMIMSNLQSVDFVAVNTDAQALDASLAHRKIQIGKDSTRGLGAGGNPERGRIAAEESIDELRDLLEGMDMVFIASGMGGGTGTGAAPVIASLARERGVLTVGIVTKPFRFEGGRRRNRAMEGLMSMKDAVDTLIVIPNDKLLQLSEKKMSFKDAFRKADDVLYQGR